MSNLIQYTNLDVVEQKGKQLYKNNSYFRSIADILEHPDFKLFFNEQFKDHDSTRSTIMFMKTYNEIEKISQPSQTPLNKYQKLSILYEVFNNGNIRQEIVKNMIKFENNEITQRFLSISD
jgi:hypothetical protein